MSDTGKTIAPRQEMHHMLISGKNILISESDEDIDATHVYSMNRTALWMWEQVNGERLTADTLAERLCATFEVTPEDARRDTERQLAEWVEMGLVTME